MWPPVYTIIDLIKIQFFVKKMTQKEVPGLSSKEKALVLDRGRNFDLIATKHGTHVGLIKIQVMFIDELCGANWSCRTFH